MIQHAELFIVIVCFFLLVCIQSGAPCGQPLVPAASSWQQKAEKQRGPGLIAGRLPLLLEHHWADAHLRWVGWVDVGWMQRVSIRRTEMLKDVNLKQLSDRMREVEAPKRTSSWQATVSFNDPPVRWIYKQPEQWQLDWTVDLASRLCHSWQPTTMSLSRSHLCLVVWDSCTVTAAYVYDHAWKYEWARGHLCVRVCVLV